MQDRLGYITEIELAALKKEYSKESRSGDREPFDTFGTEES